jgi:uncharacterized protein (TIGR02452 family)
MPNGGLHHCGDCRHFEPDTVKCSLRNLAIESSHWTTCASMNRLDKKATGPLYAIICEVRSGGAAYGDIPYFNGCRADTVQKESSGNSSVVFTDQHGMQHEFPSVAKYMEHYQRHSKTALYERLQISREKARSLGKEMVEILIQGHYTTKSGVRVDLLSQTEKAVAGTVTYEPDSNVPPFSTHRYEETCIEVRNETTLSAVKYLRTEGEIPAALNFASATSPGGGFLTGARAQEEYLARSSALWSCLHQHPMYSYHRDRIDPFYSDYIIYSPDVPIVRGEDSEFLENLYPCSIITSPAVHAHGVRRYMPERKGEIIPKMRERMLKVLAVAAKHGHTSLVLGAWGCGAFGNDSHEIAQLFRSLLEEKFPGVFKHIVFAITDWSDNDKFIGPFIRTFQTNAARMV